MLGLLTVGFDEYYRAVNRSAITRDYNGRVKIYEALTQEQAFVYLKNFPVDILMIRLEDVNEAAFKFIKKVKKMKLYKRIPMLIVTPQIAIEEKMILLERAMPIAHIITPYDARTLGTLITDAIDDALVNTHYLLFESRNGNLELDIRRFIMATPITNANKVTIHYLNEEGIQVTREFYGYTLGDIMEMDKYTNTLFRANNGAVINFNMVGGMDHYHREFKMRYLNIQTIMGKDFIENFYELLGG